MSKYPYGWPSPALFPPHYGGLRVSELASLTWAQVIPRDSGEVQLALVGKGDKERQLALDPGRYRQRTSGSARGDASSSARVFPISERRDQSAHQGGCAARWVNPAASAHWLRHAHASHAIDNGAPVTLVSQTLGTCETN